MLIPSRKFIVTFFCRNDKISSVRIATFKSDSTKIFLVAIITSWVSTTTVWTNNFLKRSNFLLVSGMASSLAHMVCIVAIYCVIIYGQPLTFENAPISHCFKRQVSISSTFYKQLFCSFSLLRVYVIFFVKMKLAKKPHVIC
jgi:hypothetical protein